MKLLTKILLMILLKIIEISVIIYLPYLLGKLAKLIETLFTLNIFTEVNSFISYWFLGFITLLLILVSLAIAYVLWGAILWFINFNWKLVNNGKGITWIEVFLLTHF